MTEVRPATQTAHNEAGYVIYINATWHTVLPYINATWHTASPARDEWQDLIHVLFFTPSSPQIIRDWGGEGGGGGDKEGVWGRGGKLFLIF